MNRKYLVKQMPLETILWYCQKWWNVSWHLATHMLMWQTIQSNKRMLTKQNMQISEEAIIGLRTMKAAKQDNVGMNNVPISLDMVWVAENSYFICTLTPETGIMKRSLNTKLKVHKRHLDEIRAEDNGLHENYRNCSTGGYGESNELCW